MRFIAGVLGGLFMFGVVLLACLFFANNMLDDLPPLLQAVGYSFCLILAAAVGWSSYRAA